jgi:hypothetical protein
MILFVFEGEDREPNIYKTLERLYLPKDNIICSFGNNIYDLYNKIMELDGDADILSLLTERLHKIGDTSLDGIRRSDISETFLFFDYDFHNSQLPMEEINRRVRTMLKLFDEETENGKLYINYPMIESIWYVKELPDEHHVEYTVSRNECKDFKRLAREFSFYDSLDFILLREGEIPPKEKYMRIRDNWEHLKSMNVRKANYIVSGRNAYPALKSDISQLAIFEGQLSKYVNYDERVAILNSFPIFIYDYCR